MRVKPVVRVYKELYNLILGIKGFCYPVSYFICVMDNGNVKCPDYLLTHWARL
jgi:hypothetical protein